MKKNPSTRPRDREQTKNLLVEAAVAILEESGFSALGINSVAEKAGVNKVLIYRYFGGLPGLLRAVAAGMDLTKTRLN
jgi:AcrR family transcriptional regulator